MAQTVIGIFNTASEAQDAADQLLANGFSESNVDVSSGGSSSTSSTSSSGSLKSHDSNESGISRFFKNLFGDDSDESNRYTTVAKRGSIVTVHVSSTQEANRVMTLLDQYGAVDVDDNYNQYSQGSSSFDTSGNTSESIPVIEENLQVGKREVETGGVRLRSRVIEKPVEESLRLRQERVRVERKQVDRLASDSDLTNFAEGTIEMTEHSEVPVVSKEARIVEEVSLGKEVEYREETINDTVRKTEVDIENLDSDQNRRNI